MTPVDKRRQTLPRLSPHSPQGPAAGVVVLALVSALLLGSPAAPADCCAAGSDPPAARAADLARDPLTVRLTAGGGAALGALVGGLVGGPLALGLGAALADSSDEAVAVPVIALPPVVVAVGAGVGGLTAGDARAAWGAGIAGTLAAGAASVAVGLVLLDGDGLVAGDRGLTFALVAAGPALAAAVAAAPTAALLVEASVQEAPAP